MINVDGVEYRNLEEQVQFLTDQYNGLDETFASKDVVNNIASVLNDQQSQITSANQQIANVNQQLQTVDGKFSNYVPIAGTQTLDAKIFKIEIALQSPEGEITRLKNINNNITLTNGNGVNILNIDEQLQTMKIFGKTVATLEDIATGQGTKVTVGGQVQSTWNADSKADATTVSSLAQTVTANSIDIAELAENKADKTSIPSVAGLASESWVNQQISAEATTRQQADTNLQNQIDTNKNDITMLKGIKLYSHTLKFGKNNQGYVVTTILTNESTAMTTLSQFAQWLYNNGFTDSGNSTENNNKRYWCNGAGNQHYIMQCSSSDGISVRIYYSYYNQSSQVLSSTDWFVDNVIKLI